jgi:hypothetical protein
MQGLTRPEPVLCEVAPPAIDSSSLQGLKPSSLTFGMPTLLYAVSTSPGSSSSPLIGTVALGAAREEGCSPALTAGLQPAGPHSARAVAACPSRGVAEAQPALAPVGQTRVDSQAQERAGFLPTPVAAPRAASTGHSPSPRAVSPGAVPSGLSPRAASPPTGSSERQEICSLGSMCGDLKFDSKFEVPVM